jgi:chromate transporter
VAYIQKMTVERNQWLDEPTFQNGVALCQTIPGATAMQMAAYVGLRSRGVRGAAVCFVGFGLPAFCFMTILSASYTHTHDLPLVLAAFKGLRAITVAIVANAALSFGKRSLTRVDSIIIAAISAAMFAIKLSPIVVIPLAALLGLLLHRSQSNLNSKATDESLIQLRSRWRVTPILLVAAAVFALLFLVNRGLFDLGILMVKIDLFAFGGGFASVPLMYHEIVDVHSWMDGATFVNGIALGQVTPGPIVITATFVGYLLYGFAGAVTATVSVFLPSFLMVIGAVPYFDRLRTSDRFNRCIAGILASFVGLLLSVTIQFALDVPWDIPRTLLAGSTLAALLLKVDVLWVVLVGTALSIMLL